MYVQTPQQMNMAAAGMQNGIMPGVVPQAGGQVPMMNYQNMATPVSE